MRLMFDSLTTSLGGRGSCRAASSPKARLGGSLALPNYRDAMYAPTRTASNPSTMLPTRFVDALNQAPCRISSFDSYMNVENVVYAPTNPVPIASLQASENPTRAVVYP